MFENRFFKISIGIILILLILFLFNQIDYIFGPLRALFAFLIIPFLLSLFLYYLLRPLVNFLTKKVKFKSLAILLTFFLLVTMIVIISFFGGSIIQTQIKSLSKQFENFPTNYESITQSITNAIDDQRIMNFVESYQIEEKIATFVESVLDGIRNNMLGFFSKVTNIGTIIVLIPLILFYFLKDDKNIYQSTLKLFPENRRKRAEDIIRNVDDTLSKYIGGQLIVAVIIGVLTYIGYLIIGMPNALILSIITMITSFIPFIGPILGILPALLIGITTNLFMVVKILLVLIVTQQIEGNIIQPKIQGNRLSIHPLMVIIVVLSFVMLFGFLGALFAVPIYAVVRVIVGDIYQDRVLSK
ncbi:MAG: AI-2E family transporter [bacterium]